MTSVNNSSYILTDFVFQAAVPKVCEGVLMLFCAAGIHHHHRFASVSMLAWVGRGLLMTLLHNLRSWACLGLNFILLRSLLFNWDHVFLGLPCFHSPSTTTCLQAFAGLPASIFITFPNHPSLFLSSTSVMSGIPSLSLNSSHVLF